MHISILVLALAGGVLGGPLKQCSQGDGLYAIGCNSKYIQCVNGVEYEQNCPPGLYFDHVLSRCERRNKISLCSSSSKNTNNRQKAIRINCKNKESGDYALQRNVCNENYYQCANEISYMRKCPYNQQFSDSIKRCDYAENCEKSLRSQLKEDAGEAHKQFIATLPPGVSTEEVDQIEHGIDCNLLPNATISKYTCSPYFFQCSQGKLYKKQCPSGLVYNVEQNLCDYPESCTNYIASTATLVVATSTTTTSSPVTTEAATTSVYGSAETTTISQNDVQADVPANFNCTGKEDGFYEVEHCGATFAACTNQIASIIPCNDQLLYDVRLNACSYPEACRSPLTQEEVPNIFNHGGIQTKPKNTSAPDFDCSSQTDGFYTITPCTSTYIQCSGGLTYTQTCPTNLVYSVATRTCDYSKKCSSETTTTSEPTTTVLETTTSTEAPTPSTVDELEIESTTVEVPTTQPSTTVAETTTVASSTPAADVIPFSCASLENGNYASGSCQTNFYQCWNGLVTKTDCPSNLVFNPYQGQCDYPSSQLGCGPSRDVPATTISTTTKTSTTPAPVSTEEVVVSNTTIQTSTTTTAAPIVQTGNSDPFCELLADGTYHSGECNEYFYKCHNFETTKLKCQAGLFYNTENGQCDYKKNIVGCGATPTTTIAPTTTNAPAIAYTCIGKVDGIYALPYCSRNYVQCVSGSAIVASCTEGLFYSEQTGLCDYSQNVITCTAKAVDVPENACSGKTDGYYSTGCTAQYYSCSSEKIRQHECPSHLKFSQEKQYCDYPQDIEQCTIPPSAQAPPTIDVNFCFGRASTVFAFAKCSEHYIVCDNGIATGGTCATPLVFNEASGLCDYRSNHPECGSQ
ncbi:unnamed protein product [Caenorhabditis angaria]|uniref:Chitin-binding type-2 domain-containing protein n=1 Tax=Caenorhabditis angaria TaxID=860376 RepID=A0A9P1J3L8_9PELO|nr:unnamed protein product [Caenorhabditis angaria]